MSASKTHDKPHITEIGIQFIKENFGDGHGLIKPEGVPWADLGLNEADRKRLVRVHKSNGTPTGSIFVQGRVVKKVEGVYMLHLWAVIANRLGLTVEGAIGRGTQARYYCAAILKAVE